MDGGCGCFVVGGYCIAGALACVGWMVVGPPVSLLQCVRLLWQRMWLSSADQKTENSKSLRGWAVGIVPVAGSVYQIAKYIS